MSESDVREKRYPRRWKHHCDRYDFVQQDDADGRLYAWASGVKQQHIWWYEDAPGSYRWPELFDHLPPPVDIPTIDGSGVFHPAPVSDVPVNHIVDANKMVSDPHWQPFDGEFKAGVEYRSRNGSKKWRFGSNDGPSECPVVLFATDGTVSAYFRGDGTYAPMTSLDITHQRRRPAETGVITELPPIQLPVNEALPSDPMERLRMAACDPDGPLYGFDIVPWIDDVTTELAMLRKKVAKDHDPLGGEVISRVLINTDTLEMTQLPLAPAPQPAAVERFTVHGNTMLPGERPVFASEHMTEGEYVRAADYDALQRELEIAKRKAASSLANNLCPDHRDKQAGKPCLACNVETLERKLAEANRRCEQLTEHERQTHERLGAILGTDDSLEECAKRLKERCEAAEREVEGYADELAQTTHDLVDKAKEVATLTAERDGLAGELEVFKKAVKAARDEAVNKGMRVSRWSGFTVTINNPLIDRLHELFELVQPSPAAGVSHE